MKHGTKKGPEVAAAEQDKAQAEKIETKTEVGANS
jgi:hypothetical protein